MTAKDLLTSLQLTGESVHSNAEHLEVLKNMPLIFTKEFFNNFIRTKYEKMPTDFQNSHFYEIIDESFTVLKYTVTNTTIQFKGTNILPCKFPLFGTVDFKEFDAFVETTDNESVVVFNEGLLMFIQRLMEIYTMEHFLRIRKKMTDKTAKLLTLNFFDVMLSFHLFSNAYYAIPLVLCDIEDLKDLEFPEKIYEHISPFDDYVGDADYMAFESEISIATYLWIAAHEYSHVILGHLKDNANISRLHLHGIDVNKINMNQKQELDADLLGAIISLKSDSSEFLANGIYFALTCLMLSSVNGNENYTIDHPPIKDRINNIFNNIEADTSYHLSYYKNIDVIFYPKYQELKNLLHKINAENISFSSIQEMQYYIYKVYSF